MDIGSRVFQTLGSKAIGVLDTLGSKVAPILGVVKPFLPAPVQAGLELFNKAIGAKDLLQNALNTGERVIQRFGGAPPQASPQAIGGMVEKARDTIEKINQSRTRPFMANRMNTLVLPAQMDMPKTPIGMMAF